MPAFGLLELGVQVLCAVHVVRTGRPYWWIYLIVFVPLVGVIVYLGAELLPELLGDRRARQAASGVVKFLDPGQGLREAIRRKEIAPTIQNKAELAEEYLAAGQPACAASLYRETLTGIHSTDPVLMLGLARALFANGEARETQATLERLRAANPEYTSAAGHLLARTRPKRRPSPRPRRSRLRRGRPDRHNPRHHADPGCACPRCWRPLTPRGWKSATS